jgi:hypothetical protein
MNRTISFLCFLGVRMVGSMTRNMGCAGGSAGGTGVSLGWFRFLAQGRSLGAVFLLDALFWGGTL